MIIRPEESGDAAVIREVVRAAFDAAEHASGTESRIVDSLRDSDALTVSLVAILNARIVGHLAISPVDIDGCSNWFGLGPVAVLPQLQGKGIGSLLIREALSQLRQKGADGCVVLGDPNFYGKFGFANDPLLTYPGIPPQYFQVLAFAPVKVSGVVRYHPAFSA